MRSSARCGRRCPARWGRTDKLLQPQGKPPRGLGGSDIPQSCPDTATLSRGREMQTQRQRAGPLIDREHNKVIRVPLQQLFSFHGENSFHSWSSASWYSCNMHAGGCVSPRLPSALSQVNITIKTRGSSSSASSGIPQCN